MFFPDADLSRKERGHRGVRPRHLRPTAPRGRRRRVPQAARSASLSFSNGSARYDLLQHTPGTTGFDVVGSWGWLRVEVPGGLVNHPENQYVRTLTSTPSPSSKN